MSTFTSKEFTRVRTGCTARYLESIPVPRYFKTGITTRFNRWVACSGPEWAVSRLKDYKACVLQSYAHPSKNMVGKPDWFVTNRNGNLRGFFGLLWRYAMASDENLKAVVYLVNIYSTCRYKSINKQTKMDIARIIMQSPVSVTNPLVARLKGDFKGCIAQLGFGGHVRVKPPFPLTYTSTGRPNAGWEIRHDVNNLVDFALYQNNKELIQEALGVVLPDSLLKRAMPIVGVVRFHFDSGLKIRHYASPSQVLQRALEPLQDGLSAVLRKMPWDCTFDQRKADATISLAMQQGRKVFSVDMEKATDSFPWALQRTVLEALVRKKDKRSVQSAALLIDIIEQGRWEVEGFQHNVMWRKGQPLGLRPSFPLFALTHGILLYSLNNRNWDKSWFILGDDVVILDEVLHSKYRSVLQEMGVKVSTAKSFDSSSIAQFAGKTFTPTLSFHQPGWLEMEGKKLLDIAAWWYPRFTMGLKDEDLINFILSLPPPHGIGRNPDGIPMGLDYLQDLYLEALVQYNLDKELKPKRSATLPSLSRLSYTDSSGKRKLPWYANGLIPFVPYKCDVPDSLKNLIHLLNETQVSGYPLSRYVRKDKHAPQLGTIDFAKSIFKIACNNRLED